MAEDPGWECVELPPELEFARKSAQENAEKNRENEPSKVKEERLCGYLSKLGARGIKTWKERWFVFEPRRCILYYYRTRECTEPLGNIDIANATFSLNANPSLKCHFDIRSGERVYQLKAPDKETVQFWLQQLKAERAKFTRLQSHLSGESRNTTSVLRPTSGLLGTSKDTENEDDENDDLISFADPVKKPATVGETSRSESSQSLSNLSLSNFGTELKNWRKSGLFGSAVTGDHSPTKAESDDRSLAVINENSTMEKRVKLRETRQSRRVDFGFMRMSAALKRRTFWGGSTSFDQQYVRETCQDCEEVKAILSTLKEAIQIAEKEIRTRDDVIESLHEQIRYEVTSKEQNETRGEADPDSLEEKDLYIEKLSNIVKKLKAEMGDMQTRLEDKDNRLSELNEKVDVFREMIYNKDQEIMALTNQIFTIEHPETAEDATEETADTLQSEPQKVTKEQLNEKQLREMCDAYIEQNKLLNSEILELVRLRKHDNEIIKDQETRSIAREAELCKLRGQYIILLKEFPSRDGNQGKELPTEMVQNLMDNLINQYYVAGGQEKSSASQKLADRYGFYETIDKEDEDVLDRLADRIQEKSTDRKIDAHDRLVGERWENFFVTQGTRPIQKSAEVKALVREGIPHEYRAKVWQSLVNHYVKHERDVAGSGYFQSLLNERQGPGSYTPAAKQIELDLLRTLPNNKFYDSMDAQGIAKLRNVLLAFSWHNTQVGYCQGLNRLGAIALLYLNEEDAFWCLVAIVDHLMPPDYFSRTLIGAQIDQRVFKDLFDEKLPKLSQLFQNLGVDLSLLSFNWFLVVFVDIFPIELTLRVWDTYLYEGNKVLFRYALAVFKSCEEELLELKDAASVYAFFRRVPTHRMNPHRISQIAFQQMNPFPKRNILTKRANHRPKLEAELREFEAMRQDRSERESFSKSEIFSDGDEDD